MPLDVGYNEATQALVVESLANSLLPSLLGRDRGVACRTVTVPFGLKLEGHLVDELSRELRRCVRDIQRVIGQTDGDVLPGSLVVEGVEPILLAGGRHGLIGNLVLRY